MTNTTRTLRLGGRLLGSLRRAGAMPGTVRGLAVVSVLRALAAGPTPGPFDSEVSIPPTDRASFRRVPGHNIWVVYQFTSTTLTALWVTTQPPVPITND